MDISSIPKATDPSDRGMGSPSEGRAATAEPAGVRARDALREQSVFLEQAQESVGLGYWVLDLEREVLLSWSPEAHRIYGTTPAEFDGKMETIWRLVHPGDASRISDAFTTALEGGAPYRIEHRIVRRDGTLRWIMSAANIQRDDTGMPKQAAGICQDITDRKRGEDEIRAAADYNRSLIEASLNPMVTIGADGRITDINGATEQITGLARAELLGTEFSDYFTEPDLARAGYEQAFRDGSVRDYPLELRHRDGHITAVLYNASVYRDPSGRVLGVMATARDVTEAKRMQAALRESEQRFRAVFDNTPVGIGEVALSGELVRVNRSFSQILGYTSDEMLTMRRLKDLLVSDNIEADLAAKQRLLSGEVDTYTAERCFRRKGGGVGAHRGLGAGEQGPGGVHLFGLS